MKPIQLVDRNLTNGNPPYHPASYHPVTYKRKPSSMIYIHFKKGILESLYNNVKLSSVKDAVIVSLFQTIMFGGDFDHNYETRSILLDVRQQL